MHTRLLTTPPHNFAQIAWGLGGSCQVHKPGVPWGPASTPGLGLGKQHVVHGPAQESKAPARQLLRPTSLTEALASGVSRLRAVSPIRRPGPKRYFLLRPRDSDRGPVVSLRTALLRLARPGPTGAIRPGTPARKGPGANGEGSAQVKPRYRDHTLYACGNSAPQPP